MSADVVNLAAGSPVAPWSHAIDAVAHYLGTDLHSGLTRDEAAVRLDAGQNVLPQPRPPSVGALVLAQLRETMIVVLLAAAVLTVVVGDFADATIIAIVIALNTSLGVLQQLRAQRAIAALSSLAAPTAHVVRDGQAVVLDAAEVVPGDLLVVAAGDLVAADGRLVQAEGIEVDEATLTGESLPVRKTDVACPPDAAVADRTSMLHAGTTMTRGRGRVVVTTTGGRTQVGQLAGLLVTTTSPPTPLQLRLARFGRQIAMVIVLLCLVVLAIGLARGEGLERMLLTAISLAVAAVPESLPAVVVLSLAMSAQRMARHAAVVRTLPAVETLGSVTVIASDKTGTLTEGSMRVAELWAAGSPDALLEAMVLCNDARVIEGEQMTGDPMEGALLLVARDRGLDLDAVRRRAARVAEYAFDHQRGRMTTVHRDGSDVTVICKGAPEVLLELIADEEDQQRRAHGELARMTDAGLRVLAVARRIRPTLPSDVVDAESGLQLLGLVGLQDPPRAAAADAVAGCRAAGVVPVMITGDHPATAAAIARDVGILGDESLVATGRDLEAGLSSEVFRRTRVFARIAPEQKLTIVERLRDAGHVVAMTGDGVNDAPALRRADVGVAMGLGGTEVARQAADVVLTDNNFATLVAAVQEGRRVYDNVRRFLLYALSGGLAEVVLMLLGPAFGLPLPLLPGQILWVNMLTHGAPGVALGAEQAEDDVLRRPPRDPAEGVLGDGLLGQVLGLGAVVASVALGVGVWAHAVGWPWQSMIFVTLTLEQLGIALALRSQQRSMLRVGLSGNPLLLLAVSGNVILLWLAVAWPPLADLLGTESLSWPELAVCALCALTAPAAVELRKVWRRRGTHDAGSSG